MRTLLIFLMSASACFGQLTIQQMQPFFNGNKNSSFTPGTLSPTFWWVGDDQSTNGNGNAIVSWADRISANIKTNTTTLRPTYSSSAHGASFSGTTWFSNTTTWNSSLFPNAVTVVAVFAPTTPATTGGFITTDSSSGNGPIFTTATQVKPFATGSTAVYSYQSTVPYVYTQRWTNGANNVVYFTNNVKIAVIANNIYGAGNIKFTGKDGEASPLFYKGTLVEELWYPTALTDDQITNSLYQYYRTTYPSLFP